MNILKESEKMNFWRNKKVLITGGDGFFGKNLIMILKKFDCKIYAPRFPDYNLTKENDIKKIFNHFKANIVIHLAADCGGVKYLEDNAGKIYFNNIMMNTLLIEISKNYGIEKFVGINTANAYPEYINIPFKENDLWSGKPKKNIASYGLSKRMMIFQSELYRLQYGFNSINLIFPNIYGPYDNFDDINSRVIPAVIKKCTIAKKNNLDHIIVWGTGKPKRDFLYVEDASKATILATEKYNQSDPINIGSGYEVSIKELVDLIIKLTGFKGKVIWDISKPDGQLHQILDTAKSERTLDFKPRISLEKGLKRLINWYNKNVIIE
jgi:GDP-L-fucose synthase